VLLNQTFTAGKQGHELALEFCHCPLAAELNQFTEKVAAQQWPNVLVDQADELLLG
jgi:hypothetical protein